LWNQEMVFHARVVSLTDPESILELSGA
jgi:hypothetical protein